MKDSQSRKIKKVKLRHKFDPPQKNAESSAEIRDRFSSSLSIKKNNVVFILPLISLLIVLLVLAAYDAGLKRQIANNTVLPEITVSVSDFPLIRQQFAPDITAESAIIIDDTSKTILYEKKPALRFSMASTTKIMTTLVGMEYFAPKDIITVQSAGIEGTRVGFGAGEKIFFEDMLYALMLPSGNDAAYAIAENYPGGVPAFVAKMNEKAATLGLNYTHYADPAGLDDDNNYTTVHDLARLASYALKNEELTKIIATKQKVIHTVDGGNQYTLFNLNKLLGENGVMGMKTGFTQGAGGVLVTTKIEKGHVFIIVVMKSEDRFADTEKLLGLITNNVTFIRPQLYLIPQNRR